MKFREHVSDGSNGYFDSMALIKEVRSQEELIEIAEKKLGVSSEFFELKYQYYFDDRDDWKNHWVYAVVEKDHCPQPNNNMTIGTLDGDGSKLPPLKENKKGVSREVRKIYADFGARVLAFRKRLDLNQETVAALLGVTREQVSAIECGACGIAMHRIHKLCSILHCEPNDLFPRVIDHVYQTKEIVVQINRNRKPKKKQS